MEKKVTQLLCSFCGEEQKEGNLYLKGNSAVICAKCLQNGQTCIDDALQRNLGQFYLNSMSEEFSDPQKIHKLLDEYVISHSEAKKVLAVAIYTHYRRLFVNAKKLAGGDKKSENISFSHLKDQKKSSSAADVVAEKTKKSTEEDDIELEKSNILMIGPTGSGKTLLAATIAKIVNVPFAVADATTLTEAGYVGDDVENILLRLLQNADYNVAWAERGIVFLDEIDKIGRKSENMSITRDVSGEGVQQALLKIIEGTVASVHLSGGRKHPQSQTVDIDTKNILFICGGAFVGLDNILLQRIGTKKIGFKTDQSGDDEKMMPKDLGKGFLEKNEIKSIIPDDLIKYGLIPELVGRLPIIVGLQDLDDEDLINILVKPRNSLIGQYKKLLALEDIDLVVEESAYKVIIERAKKLKTGARSLRSVMESLMLEILYNAPKHRGSRILLNEQTLSEEVFFSS